MINTSLDMLYKNFLKVLNLGGPTYDQNVLRTEASVDKILRRKYIRIASINQYIHSYKSLH